MTEQVTRAFHGDPALKAEVLAQLEAHRAADQIIQGQYWADGRGCAVGCLTHDPSGGHGQYPVRWGLPEWLARLEDRVFEGLPIEEARAWPIRLMTAIPVGAVIDDAVADRIAVARLEQTLELAPSWPDEVRDGTVTAVRDVIAVLTIGGDRSAARSAAESAARSAAESAAWSAESAAWSAAWSARSAAESAAWSAAWSARSAAESAWSAEADRIITVLAALPTDRDEAVA